MPTIEDWEQFLATAKVVDDDGAKATGKKTIGTRLADWKPGKVVEQYYPLKPVWGERAKPQVQWTLTARNPRTCHRCLDAIPDGSQAVYTAAQGYVSHPRCVDNWHDYLHSIRGAATEAEKRSALKLTYHRKAKA